MAELDDALEAAILAEDRFFEQGHSEGVRIGEQQGFDEGVAFGLSKGKGMGLEVGYYSGCLQSFLAVATMNDRTRALVVSLQELISAYDFANPLNEELHECLQQIRGKFRVIASQLRAPELLLEVPGASSTGLSF